MAGDTPKPGGPPPLQPPTPTTTNPNVGEQWMAKHPSIGGQWQPTTIVAHPTEIDKVLAQFQDGTLYEVTDLEMSGPMQPQTAQPVAQGSQGPASASPLKPEYEAFRQVLTQLNSRSRTMFQLPLGVLLLMVTRLGVEQETEMTGKTIDFGNVQTFVPDDPSFDRLVENYLYELQRREQGTSPE